MEPIWNPDGVAGKKLRIGRVGIIWLIIGCGVLLALITIYVARQQMAMHGAATEVEKRLVACKLENAVNMDNATINRESDELYGGVLYSILAPYRSGGGSAEFTVHRNNGEWIVGVAYANGGWDACIAGSESMYGPLPSK